MVCLGNICRSPLAEGIMADIIAQQGLDWAVDSAGTSGWHNGELPDRRSIDVARNHGIDITGQRSRKLIKQDLADFDHVMAMDASNYNNILALCSSDAERAKVAMILNYSYPNENRQVPDPYYEGGFEGVYQMLRQACEAFVDQQI